MFLFILLIALMIATTVLDGWSQQKMLVKNGGKGYETSSIYGTSPTYGRYFLINLPVLAFFVFDVLMLHFRYHQWGYIPIAIAFSLWHLYGFNLNRKYF
jgi:hypothetical protein